MVISFFHDQFTIQDPILKRMIGRGRRLENLCVLEATLPFQEFASNLVSVQVWHNRLGHPSKRILACLKDQINCQKSSLDESDACYVCPLAKHKRLPFISNHHMSQFPFDLVHCDVW